MPTRLYRPVQVTGKSFAGVKKLTVPNQSLSLSEIVRRFVRRQPLPVNQQEGVYETRFGDLEKIARMDIHDQLERVAELKKQIAAFEARSAQPDTPDITEPVGSSVPPINSTQTQQQQQP